MSLGILLKPTLVVICLFSLYSNILSQTNFDSLYNVYLEYKKERKYDSTYNVAQLIRAKANQKKGEESYWSAQSLSLLGTSYFYLGNRDSSLHYYLLSANLFKRWNPRHIEYSKCINDIGGIYFIEGNYSQAEIYWLQSLNLRSEVPGLSSNEYASSLNNLALLYKTIGNYSQAEFYFLESLKIKEIVNGESTLTYSFTLNNLGGLYMELGDYKNAEEYYLRCENIRKEFERSEPLYYAQVLNNLGSLYVDIGNYNRAEEYLHRSLKIKDSCTSKESLSYAETLGNLGSLYMKIGAFDKAERYFNECLKIEGLLPSKESLKYINTLASICELYLLKSDYVKAIDFSRKMISMIFRSLESNFSSFSLKQKENFIFKFQDYIDQYETIANKTPDNLLSYDIALNLKNCILNSFIEAKYFLEKYGSKEDLNNYLLWRATNENLSNNFQIEDYNRSKAIDSIKVEIEILEKKLLKLPSRVSRSFELGTHRVRDIQKSLSNGELAIDFMKYFDLIDSSSWYFALVVDSLMDSPLRIKLCKEVDLLESIEYRGRRRADYVSSVYGIELRSITPSIRDRKSLYELIWESIDSLAGNYGTIYYSPTGLLHELNFSAIITSDSTTLIDNYSLYRLSSTGKICNQPDDFDNMTIAIFSDISYDYNNENITESRVVHEDNVYANANYWNDTSRGDLKNQGWSQLRYTKQEGEYINFLFSEKLFDVDHFTGYSASEDKFKLLDSRYGISPRVIHIATHGFFNPDPDEARNKYGNSVYLLSKDPMYNSGLIMSGANGAWTGSVEIPFGRQDGILTAKEISTMDLNSTELVVLSACETGLGEVKNYEGVFGLQRAFKMAGVKYLLMSLWEVPDFATKELMVTFYKSWLDEDMTIPDAFNHAQKEMKAKYHEPYFWAGFILME